MHGPFKVSGLLGNMVSMVVIMSLMFAAIICYIRGLVTYNYACKWHTLVTTCALVVGLIHTNIHPQPLGL